MLHKAFLLFCCLFGVQFACQAQLSQLPLGARSMAMGGASLTVKDGWASFNNVAGLSSEEELSAGFTYHYPYSLSELSTGAAYVVAPLKFGNLGLSVARFGNNLFSEQKLSLNYAQQVANIDFGIRVNLHQFSAQNYGSVLAPSIDLGSNMQLTDNIYLGASILNILRANLADFEDERVPTVIKIGISYRPTDKLMVNLETAKDIDFDPVFNAGIEYEVVKQLFVRSGISTNPTITYFGAGFHLKKFRIDYSINNHNVLGISQQLSIAMNISKKGTPTE